MHKRFKFNEHGVCINPDQSAKVGEDYTAYIEITTAVVRGSWTYGIRYMLVDRGGCWGSNLSNKYWFKTQEAAVKHALKWAKKYLLRQIKMEDSSNVVCKKAGKLLDEINKLLPKQKYTQLELFDFI